jgi:hypothetical protein
MRILMTTDTVGASSPTRSTSDLVVRRRATSEPNMELPRAHPEG